MTDVVLIANGDPDVGGGHIARCTTLGRALCDQGANVRLVIKPDAMVLLEGLDTGEVQLLPCAFEIDELNDTIGETDIIIVDNYDWMASFERKLGPSGRRLVVIDDLANRQHDCDLLIDQNFGRNRLDYNLLVPAHAERCIGMDYAMLRPEFSTYRITSIARRNDQGQVRRVLVSMGMTDVGGITLRVVRALRACGVDAQLDVVVTRIAPSLNALQTLADADAGLTLHVEPSNLAELMTHADVAIGAIGATTWERFCLGLPTVSIVLAENQENLARKLDLAGLLRSFPKDQKGIEQAAQALKSLIESPSERQAIAHMLAQKVDGQGAHRVAQAILRLS